MVFRGFRGFRGYRGSSRELRAVEIIRLFWAALFQKRALKTKMFCAFSGSGLRV